MLLGAVVPEMRQEAEALVTDLAELVRRIGSSGLVVETSGGGQGTISIRIHRP